MDPLSALGIAGNVIQFVDFATKLFKEGREVYRSGTAASQETRSLSNIAKELSTLSNSFTTDDLKSLGLRDVASQCSSLARDLLAAVDKLTVTNENKLWRSFVVALRSVLKEKEIDKLWQRVTDIQQRLGLQMQRLVLEQQSRLVKAFLHFEESNRRVELDRNQVSTDFKILMLETLKDIDKKASPDVWLNGLRILQPAMANVAVKTKQISTQQTFLRTLSFDEMRRRRFNVVAAHRKTCEWAFEDYAPEQGGEGRKILLKDWLQNRSGHFWLQGKPGSGKSTLMKFICGSPKTRDLLTSWASSAQKRLVTAEFFFWHSGSPLEKSQEGLLRSLLFGILSKCPDLIDEIRSGLVRDADSSAVEWTREELFEIFRRLANQDLSFRFCFFIDGLDEYAGPHEELIETLERLLALPDIKICLSSRPWPVFKDAFGKESDPWLRLQDLTRGDIRRYVSDKFHKNASFQTMAARDSQYHQLIEEVVNRAQGVFLWVYLVVQSLLQGLSGRDPMSDLYYRLDRLPQDLNDFFRHMISQIDDAYLKSRTVRMFQLALAAPEPSLVAIYTILDEMEQDPDICERDGSTLAYFEQLQETTERRLEARCKGLLEVSNFGGARAWGADRFFRDKVVFLHRTVRDFLNGTSLQELFGAECDLTYDANFALCKATGVAIRAAAIENLGSDTAASCDVLLDQLFYHAHEVEVNSETHLGDQTVAILEQVEERLRGSTWWKWRRKDAAFVGSAVEWNLRRFVAYRLQISPKLMKTRERPLLDHALVPGKAKYLDEELRSSAMVNLLLAATAKPNSRFNDSTTWARFLQALKDNPDRVQQEYMVDITRNLIGAGADPNLVLQKTEVEVINIPRRKATGRSADLYKSKGGSKTISKVVEKTKLEDVLTGLFGSDRCAFIMSARPCPDSKSSWQGLGAIFELLLSPPSRRS